MWVHRIFFFCGKGLQLPLPHLCSPVCLLSFNCPAWFFFFSAYSRAKSSLTKVLAQETGERGALEGEKSVRSEKRIRKVSGLKEIKRGILRRKNIKGTELWVGRSVEFAHKKVFNVPLPSPVLTCVHRGFTYLPSPWVHLRSSAFTCASLCSVWALRNTHFWGSLVWRVTCWCVF